MRVVTRVAAAKARATFVELERSANAKDADRVAEEERTRRVAASSKESVNGELVRSVASKDADAAGQLWP